MHRNRKKPDDLGCKKVQMKKRFAQKESTYWGKKFTVKELRKIAKKYHIKRYSSMRKDELMEVILSRLHEEQDSILSPLITNEFSTKQKAAVAIIEKWWKYQMEVKKSICPITLENISFIKGIAPFCLVEPVDGSIFFFYPNEFAEFMMSSLNFINPCTRRKLVPVEILRLQHITHLPIFDLWLHRDEKQKERELFQNEILLLENIIEQTIEFVIQEGMDIFSEGNDENDIQSMIWFILMNTLRIISICIYGVHEKYREKKMDPSEYLDILSVKLHDMIIGSPLTPNQKFMDLRLVGTLDTGVMSIISDRRMLPPPPPPVPAPGQIVFSGEMANSLPPLGGGLSAIFSSSFFY